MLEILSHTHARKHACTHTHTHQAQKESELGNVDLEDEAERRKDTLYVPNWFTVDVKTGVSSNFDVARSLCPCLLQRPSRDRNQSSQKERT